jgi:hypothetical protein
MLKTHSILMIAMLALTPSLCGGASSASALPSLSGAGVETSSTTTQVYWRRAAVGLDGTVDGDVVFGTARTIALIGDPVTTPATGMATAGAAGCGIVPLSREVHIGGHAIINALDIDYASVITPSTTCAPSFARGRVLGVARRQLEV